MLRSTDDDAAIRAALRAANEMYDRLEAAPPTPEEKAIQAQNPRMPRSRVLRLLVQQLTA
jgi:hypothetical protein